MQNFAYIANPLTTLLHKGVKFKWTDKCQAVFDYLKQALTMPPILVFPDFSKQFCLYTDVSNISISFVLGQCDLEGDERVIAYGGRALRSAEKMMVHIRQGRPGSHRGDQASCLLC